jgi:hydroxymethylbilane synthase
LRLAAERAYLATLDGSCETPIAGLAGLSGGTLWLTGEILRPDGSDSYTGRIEGPAEDGPKMGAELARSLLKDAGPGFFDWRG